MPSMRVAAASRTARPTSGVGSSASSSKRSRVNVAERSARSSTARCSSGESDSGGGCGGACGIARAAATFSAWYTTTVPAARSPRRLKSRFISMVIRPDAVEERQEVRRAQKVAGQSARPAHRRAVIVEHREAEQALARRLAAPHRLEPGGQQPFDEEGGDQHHAHAGAAEAAGEHRSPPTPRAARSSEVDRPGKRARHRARESQREFDPFRCGDSTGGVEQAPSLQKNLFF